MKIKVKQSKHVLVIDSREQRPLYFSHPDVVIQCSKLDCGDYCMRFKNGYVSTMVFERKSIGDLWGTLSSGYKRFRKEIMRAQISHTQIVLIIEGSFTKVTRGYRRSKIHPLQIIRTLFSIWHRYGIIPIFAKDRLEASEIILQYYMAVWRGIEEGRIK